MKTFAKMMVAAIVAVFVMCLLIVVDMPDNVVIPAYFFVGLTLCLAWGVFDMPAKRVNKKQSNKTIGGILRDAA